VTQTDNAPRPVKIQPLSRRGEIRAAVLARISSGAWPPEHRIPSEHELMAEFGVSRMTVHTAMSELAKEGVLTRVKGLGTFVAPPRAHLTLVRVTDPAEEIRKRGARYEAEVVVAMERRATAAELAGFNLPEGGSLYHLVVLHKENGSPVVLEDRRAPLTCANFLRYVDAQAYDNGVFFRAARDRDDPTHGQIVGRPEPKNHPFPPIAHESTTMTGLRHVAGTISLGRFEPGSATCNFFICASPEPYLDAHPGEPGDNLGYAAFGSVVTGLGVVRKILSLPTNGKTKYVEQRGQWLDPPVTITSMRRV